MTMDETPLIYRWRVGEAWEICRCDGEYNKCKRGEKDGSGMEVTFG